MPPQLWEMELWEFNHCVAAYNRRKRAEEREKLAVCWQTASFVGAAFAGKLRKLNRYLKDNDRAAAPQISKEAFDERLKKLEERRRQDGS